jgi:hypothetical protein
MFCVWGWSVASGSCTNAQCGTVGRTVTEERERELCVKWDGQIAGERERLRLA